MSHIAVQKGVTAEGVAVESGHHAIAELLAKERLEAPAQVMHVDETSGDAIWIGDEVTAAPGTLLSRVLIAVALGGSRDQLEFGTRVLPRPVLLHRRKRPIASTVRVALVLRAPSIHSNRHSDRSYEGNGGFQ